MISLESERITSSEQQKDYSLAFSGPGQQPRKIQIALFLLSPLPDPPWEKMKKCFVCLIVHLAEQSCWTKRSSTARKSERGWEVKQWSYMLIIQFFLQWHTHTHMDEKPPWWPEAHYWEQSCVCVGSMGPLRPLQCSLTLSEMLSSHITSRTLSFA